MPSLRNIKESIEEGQSLKLITQAYGEIASLKIRKIRQGVERNRSFFFELAGVYRIVKKQALLKKVHLQKKKKMVCILLTSDFGFYGNIDKDVIRFFIETTPRYKTDRIVIGKTGDEYLKSMNYFNPYQRLKFKSDLPNPQELRSLAENLKDYSQILVFYPQLSTILIQKPTIIDITQSSNYQLSTINYQHAEYTIFEPELEKILQFFDNQINTLMLEQAFFEAELSRTASRILSMDQAQTEANRFIKNQKGLLAHTQRVIEGARLLENLASMAAIKQDQGSQL